ncbi:protein Niban 2-like [Styela clava]
MGELMTKHMWNERSKEVVADTKNMVIQVAERYKSAYSYCILQQMRKDLSGKNEKDLLLNQRKWQNYNRPLQSGSLYVLGGSEHRKWRRRYCVLQPDYTLEVYDTEEDFDAANKPRFFRKFSSFKVIDNVDTHFSQLVKEYLRDFGFVRENVSEVIKKVGSGNEPSKRPTQHVLALYHKYRGTFYMAADSAVEKEKWLKSMQDAERQLSGVHCENHMQREAFEFAIRQACDAEEHCGISVTMSGTQEEITADFITDYLSNGCKTMLQTKVKGDVIKKYKMWDAISKRLAGSVESVVKVDYPPLGQKAESEAEALKSRMMSLLPQINTVYETLCSEIIASMDPNFNDDLEAKILPKIPDLVTRMGDSMSLSLREVRDLFMSLIESVQRQTLSSPQFANHIDRFFLDHLDVAPRNPEIMTNAFQTAIGKKSLFMVLSETFPKVEYTQHEVKLCLLLQKLLDSAICTFEMLCGESVAKNEGKLQASSIAKIQGRVLKKLNHDNIILTKKFLRGVTSDVTFRMLRHMIYHDSRNKLRNFEDFIPSDMMSFMPIANIFKDVVTDHINEQIQMPLAAAFKRLANDHFNMTSYHSNSTINSHSSNTSDELHSVLKRETSSCSTVSLQSSPTNKSAPVVLPSAEAKVTNESEEVQEITQESELLKDPCEGVQMDGETGEYAVDEYGEPIMTGPCSETKESTPNTEISDIDLNPDLGDSETVTDVENNNKDMNIEKEPDLQNEPSPQEMPNSDNLSPELGSQEDNIVKESCDIVNQNLDPEMGVNMINSEKKAESDDYVTDKTEESEEKESVGTKENIEDVNDTQARENAQEQHKSKEEDFGETEKNEKIEESNSIKNHTENTPEAVKEDDNSQDEKMPEDELNTSENADILNQEKAVEENVHDIKPDPEKGGQEVYIDSEQKKITEISETTLNENKVEEKVETDQNSSISDENAISTHEEEIENHIDNKIVEDTADELNNSVHQNGDVILNEQLISTRNEQDTLPPVAPARKKKHNDETEDKKALVINNGEHGDNKIDLVQQQSCIIDEDLEKYNGVVEQIIHTGEEKLI